MAVVVHALHALGLLLAAHEGGQNHRGENDNDGDDNEEFNQSKSAR